jgi:carotenoid cleavage dioxygenase-like enzyme
VYEQGYLHLDLETGEVSTWYAGPKRFVGEGFLATPTPSQAQQGRQAQEEEEEEEEEEELRAYWVGTVHDGDTSSVLVFHAGPRLREGPICTLKLRHRMPWGIHADFVPEQL